LLVIISGSILAKTGDGQNNGNTRQYRNKTVCVGCTERTLFDSTFHAFCLFTLCSASVNVLHIVFGNCLYGSTVKWETSDFQKGQIGGACLAGASVTKIGTLLGVSRAAVSSL